MGRSGWDRGRERGRLGLTRGRNRGRERGWDRVEVGVGVVNNALVLAGVVNIEEGAALLQPLPSEEGSTRLILRFLT